MPWWVNRWISVELVSALPTQPAAYRERDAPRQRAAATRRRETDEARPLGYLSVAVVASLLAHIRYPTQHRGDMENASRPC